MMKLSEDDLYNLSCLKLAQMGVWDSQRALDSMRFGRKTRTRTQKKYLKKMVELLFQIDTECPGLIEKSLEIETVKKMIKEKENGTVQ
jgi:hypothetical protein